MHVQFDPIAAAENRERQLKRLARKKARQAAKKAKRKANKATSKLNPPKPKPNPSPKYRPLANGVYKTASWKQLRYEVLKEANGRCCLCGASAHDGVRLNVDHIKPVSRHPHLALDKANLQVLCSSCNWGKGGRDETDWRAESREDFTIPWHRLDAF